MKQLRELLDLDKDEEFVYRAEGRPDPFKPFVTEKTLQAEMSKAQGELAGLERYEPGQLSLVAIIMGGKKSVAMVQDSMGMGYVLRKGMKIGYSGVVEAIKPNAVIIKQQYQTVSGETNYKTVEMVLKKEGEKQQ
ncbi:MAG: pilus assembly protein PilP [Desulfobulbaceae bacterium]|nr:pilus assembly protein PilP [Desulfobulbaceae bacterium]